MSLFHHIYILFLLLCRNHNVKTLLGAYKLLLHFFFFFVAGRAIKLISGAHKSQQCDTVFYHLCSKEEFISIYTYICPDFSGARRMLICDFKLS
ncbi:hypothetical protein GDO86_010471 [Hymenochirus boettgeri]|uniref:Uncharacterized protein n=1 Tax=Hymenochirus boettgeri TaxID=247094 RepID=A0A8T2JPL6_9PIPI|nr:hypothetical protein GDO86_010471 [Hymenochirus boettgeri]